MAVSPRPLTNNRSGQHAGPTFSTIFGDNAMFIKSMSSGQKQDWECPNCNTQNMGSSRNCGDCGDLNPKYVVKKNDIYKQSMVKKQRAKLLSSHQIFKKLNKHFPKWKKYKQIESSKSSKRRLLKKKKSKRKQSMDDLNQNIIKPLYPLFHIKDNPSEEPEQKSTSEVHDLLNSLDWDHPFEINNDDNNNNYLNTGGSNNLRPTIISDDDGDSDLTLGNSLPFPIGTEEDIININDEDPYGTDFGLIDQAMQNIRAQFINDMSNDNNNNLPQQLTLNHNRQQSMSAPSTPPSRSIKSSVLRVDPTKRPLLLGVIHTPAPSRKNRLDIVMKNINHIVTLEYDGVFFINHGYSANHLISIIKHVAEKHPHLWLGANFMGIAEKKIFKFVKSHKLHKILKGIWCENSGIALDPDDLDNIFINNFMEQRGDRNMRFRSATQELVMVDDTKADETYDTDNPPITSFNESASNLSAVSSGSTKSVKSNSSNNGNNNNNNNNNNKKRVTFSELSNSLINENSNNNNNNKLKKTISKPSLKTNASSSNKQEEIKRDDGMARTRLLRIKKYKFNGLYFGGVDLKSSKCIKIPTQKAVRTRRRTYSADVGGGVGINGDNHNESMSKSPRRSPRRSPRSNSTHTKSATPSGRRSNQRSNQRPRGSTNPTKGRKRPKRPQTTKGGTRGRKKTYNRALPATPTRSKSSKRLPATPTPKSRNKNKNRNSNNNNNNFPKIKNRKSRSSSHALHRTSAEIRGDNTIQRNSIKRPQSVRKKNNKKQRKLELKKSVSTNTYANGDDDTSYFATISSEDDKKYNNNNNSNNDYYVNNKNTNKSTPGGGKFYSTPKWKKNNKSKNKHGHNHKDKKNIYRSKTDVEDDIETPQSLFNNRHFFAEPPPLAVAGSLELHEVSPKSPSFGPNSINDEASPSPPQPMYSQSIHSSQTNNENIMNNIITTNNIKMHNIHMHRPMNGAMTAPPSQNGNDWKLSSSSKHSLHEVQVSAESKSSSRDSVYSNHSNSGYGYNNNGDEAGSVYSHTSQLSETWSEYGSVGETLDDYFSAIHKLGTFASDGYMHVITTSGKGKNIDIKIKALHNACYKKCLLAVASGIRIENVKTFLPFVDILMVSTCISHDFHLFDPRKMLKFKRTVDSYFENL